MTAKWFELYARKARDYHSATLQIYLKDPMKEDSLSTSGTDQFNIIYQANAGEGRGVLDASAYYGAHVVPSPAYNPDYLVTIAKIVRKLGLGSMHRLPAMLNALESAGYKACAYHPDARQYIPVDQWPTEACYTASNDKTRVTCFATDEGDARRKLAKEFARRAAAASWEARYAQDGFEQWIADSKPVRCHGVREMHLMPVIPQTQPAAVTA